MIRIFESPHFDDMPLTIGGLIIKLKAEGNLGDFIDANCFSRSNYQKEDELGNRDISEKRIAHATGIRILEELAMLKHLSLKELKLYGLDEVLLRGYALNHGAKLEFPKGIDWDKDRAIVAYLVDKFKQDLQTADEVYFPLAIRGHVDHLIVREAGLTAIKELDRSGLKRATSYFGEDQPYAGTAEEADWEETKEFIETNKLTPITYQINLDEKLRLLDLYPSQTQEAYFEGVRNRALMLQKEMQTTTPMERIYRYPRRRVSFK